MTPDDERQPDEGVNGARARLSAAEAATFAHGLASLSAGSLPLPGGLRAMADELDRGRLRAALLALARRLERGVALEAAIEEEEERFPGHLLGLVRAGVKSGRLAEVLSGYVVAHLTGAELKRSIWLGLAYPTMLMVGMIGVLLYVCVAVVSDFNKLFLDFGVNLPVITRRLLMVSGWVSGVSVGLLTGLGLLILGLLLLFRFALGPVQRRRTLVGMPLFGSAWRWLSLAEFSRVLALLLEGQMPLTEALPLAGEGSEDAELEEACKDVTAQVALGATLSKAVADRDEFPAALTQVLGWAEGHSTLPEALGMVAEMFEARARSQVRFGQALVGLIVVVLAVFEIGFLQMGLLLPMMGLISKLSG